MTARPTTSVAAAATSSVGRRRLVGRSGRGPRHSGSGSDTEREAIANASARSRPRRLVLELVLNVRVRHPSRGRKAGERAKDQWTDERRFDADRGADLVVRERRPVPQNQCGALARRQHADCVEEGIGDLHRPSRARHRRRPLGAVLPDPNAPVDDCSSQAGLRIRQCVVDGDEPCERVPHDVVGRGRPVEDEVGQSLGARVRPVVERHKLVGGHASILSLDPTVR